MLNSPELLKPVDPQIQMVIAVALGQEIVKSGGCNIELARQTIGYLSEGPLRKTLSDFLERINH